MLKYPIFKKKKKKKKNVISLFIFCLAFYMISYGYFITNNRYFICHSQPTIQAIFDKQRNGGNYFEFCGRYALKVSSTRGW